MAVNQNAEARERQLAGIKEISQYQKTIQNFALFASSNQYFKFVTILSTLSSHSLFFLTKILVYH